jgi:hypothetical protein
MEADIQRKKGRQDRGADHRVLGMGNQPRIQSNFEFCCMPWGAWQMWDLCMGAWTREKAVHPLSGMYVDRRILHRQLIVVTN